MNYKSIISLVLRLVIAYTFISMGAMKLGADAGTASFIGGAFHKLGLTFLTQEVWTTVLGVGEILIGLGAVLGLFTRTAMGVAIIILVGAINAKGWTTGWTMMNINSDILYILVAAVVVYLGAGKWSLDNRFFKKDSCGCCKPGCTCGDCKACSKKDPDAGKEIIEA